MTTATATPTINRVPPRDATGGELIDVRTPGEFAAVHADGARCVPLDKLDCAAFMASRTAGGRVYLLCRSGKRATMAAERFAAGGFNDIAVVEGGTDAWIAAGLPVVRGKGVISLERQVRIVAGSLVLIGAVLALTVHPWLIGISAFIGAGLVFAGVTDFCGMAMMLAKMPWNQAGADSTKG